MGPLWNEYVQTAESLLKVAIPELVTAASSNIVEEPNLPEIRCTSVESGTSGPIHSQPCADSWPAKAMGKRIIKIRGLSMGSAY